MRHRELLSATGILALLGLFVVADARALRAQGLRKRERGGSRSRGSYPGWSTILSVISVKPAMSEKQMVSFLRLLAIETSWLPVKMELHRRSFMRATRAT